MAHPIYRVTACEIAGADTLRVRFDDQTERIIDFWPALAGDLYGPLRELSLFNQVRIDPEVYTLVWPRGIGRRSGSIFPQAVLDTVSVSDDNVNDFGWTGISGPPGIGRQHQGPCRSSLNSWADARGSAAAPLGSVRGV